MTHRPHRIALTVAAAVTILTMSGSRSVIAMSGVGRLSSGVSRVSSGVGRVFRPRTPGGGAVADQSSPRDARGATTTRLADGRWLVAGGATADGPVATAAVIDPATGRVTPIAGLQVARTGHSATLLADGTVLIAGGRGAAGQLVTTAEIFDPRSATFLPVTIAGARPRADHTATLLTDGRVLVAGGSDTGGVLANAEVWDVANATASAASSVMAAARTQHEAELLADGRVRVSRGIAGDGSRIESVEIFDPATGQFMPAAAPPIDRSAPRLMASIPENGASDVALDVRIALRFSAPLVPDSVTAASVVMSGSEGPIEVTLVPAEGGRLVFVTPRLALLPDTTYLVSIDGAVDARGVPVLPATVTLTTKASQRSADVPDEEAWTPDGSKGWKSHRPDSPWRTLKPLESPPGVTALAGQVLRLDGLPLPDVTLEMDEHTTRTDRTGRFLLLLDGVPSGEHTLDIDARTANRPNRTYGFYEVRWKIAAGRTNVLPFTIWSPLIDTAHQVTIPSPATQETVVTTPVIPGLELHLPAGTTIVDEDHEVVRTVSITPIPLDRTPFPLPDDATFTMFFTIQPGGAYLRTSGTVKGGWLVYPKAQYARAGQRVQFFNYDPDDKGWYVYGMGKVEADRVVPEPRTRVYAFTGASFNDDNAAPSARWSPPGDCCRTDGDPVDLATGLFEHEMTDVAIPDVMPLGLTRRYNSADVAVRAFGRGMMDPYRIFLYTELAFEEADLILDNGARIHYVRTSATGLPWYQTEFEHTTAPTGFYKSTIKFDLTDNGWHLRLKDGTVYVFGHMAPLQAIRDRNGNETRLTWSGVNSFGLGNGNLVRVTSPNGRWLEFSYYANSRRVYQARDNIGRTWTYGYDVNENLTTVTDPENHTTTYLYDTNNQLIGVRPRNLEGTTTNLVTNEYTTAADAPTPPGWVKNQTHADGGVYQFVYMVSNGKSTQTDVTDPRGFIRRVIMNPDGYTTQDTRALGQPEEQTASSVRVPLSNFVSSSAMLDHSTAVSHDTMGNVTQVVHMPNTQSETKVTYTYENKFNRITSVKDPLDHITSFEYDANGNLTRITDPLNHATTLTYDALGRIRTSQDPGQRTTVFSYQGGDLQTVTNPLGQVAMQSVDAIGRVTKATDQLGRFIEYAYDNLGRVTRISGSSTLIATITYFPDGQRDTVSDANGHNLSYTYDAMGRIESRVDRMQASDRFWYDENGNLVQSIDRLGSVTTNTYDALDRLANVRFADGSTIGYTYDAFSRLSQINDSSSGVITRTYDAIDRVLTESTVDGAVTYEYDAAGRRTTFTLAGQPSVIYSYDDANRLTSVTHDGLTVDITYDSANRREAVSSSNGVVTEYTYDLASRLTGLSFKFGGSALGSLTYTYDAAGNRREMGGTFARTLLPRAVATASYNAADQTVQWAGATLSYDANGNMTGDGLTSYGWSARGQLVSITGETTGSFGYDAIGRRTAKTMSLATAFVYDGFNVAQERVGGNVSANVLTNPLVLDEMFSRADANGRRIPLVDGVGSVIALIDDTGIIRTSYAYAPFGEQARIGDVSGSASTYSGREADTSELYYYRARYYSARLNRFISQDPIDVTGGLNLYVYAANDPVNRNDPSGTVGVNVTGPVYQTVTDWDALTVACGGRGGFGANGCTTAPIRWTCTCIPNGCGGYRAKVAIEGNITVTAINNPRAVATPQDIFAEEMVHVNDIRSFVERIRKRGETLEGQTFRWKWSCEAACTAFDLVNTLDGSITVGTRDWPGRNPHAPVKRTW